MIKVAIFTRHSEVGNPEIANNLEAMSRLIDRDLTELPTVLPDDQAKYLDTWRKILQFYPASKEETRKKRLEKSRSLGPARQNPGANLETSFDNGKFRPKDEKDDDACKSRRREASSDPTSYGPSNLKRMASEILDSDRTTKTARILGSSPGTTDARSEEEWNRQSEDLFHKLHDLYQKNPDTAHRLLNDAKKEVNDARKQHERVKNPPKNPAKLAKQARRKAKVDAR